MPPLTELNTFIALSKVLTGENRLDKKLAEGYLNRLKATNADVMRQLVEEFNKISKDPYMDFEVKRRIVETKEKGKEKLPMMAQQIIRLWYTGEFFPIGADGKLVANALPGTQKEYYSGLIWPAIQAHPPTLSKRKYGYWAKKPATK